MEEEEKKKNKNSVTCSYSCLFQLEKDEDDWLGPHLLRIAANKVAFDMMERPSQMEGASCFHRAKVRNCNNAGKVVVEQRWNW